MQGSLPVHLFLADQDVRRSPRTPAAPPPVVSVVLPTYARGRDGRLERAIRSVLSQDFASLELIVVDDGSTDGSEQLIAALAAEDPRLVHVRHDRNSGLPALRVNEGIELARGEYLAFQFDDDAWRAGALRSLVEEAKRQREPSVVVGRTRLTAPGGEWILPLVDLNLVNLYEQNRLANNSVLLPRHLLERHGMFDCHIGMRRLCDWDLWLRLLRHVPFVVIDTVVSDVVEGNPGAIGRTVPWDLTLFRFLHDIPRDRVLAPDRWREYGVDSLAVGDVELPAGIRRRLYESQVVPFYLRQRHLFPQIEGFSATLPTPRRSFVYVKGAWDVSNDISFTHFDGASSHRGRYKLWFEPLAQLLPHWQDDADGLVLVRPVEDHALGLMAQAQDAGLPVALYLDDDLLSFHELGPQFDYLAPGQPAFENLASLARDADVVWATGNSIAGSMRPLNPRLVPFRGSVPEDALPPRARLRDPSRPLRIGYVGSGYRVEEFREIWDGLLRFSEAHGDDVVFEFWGLDVGPFPRLRSPVVQRPFTFSYPRYLRELREAGFDVLLAPLLAHPKARLGKCLIKYFETAVAGAVGVFSDVPPYRELPAGVTCFKAANDASSWFETLSAVAQMEPEHFDLVRQRALEHVREEYTEIAQVHKFEAALQATEFHQKTRALRHADGRPRVVYVLHSANLAGAELQLWRRLRAARAYGIEPVVVLPRVTETTAGARGAKDTLAKDGIELDFADYACLDRLPLTAPARSSDDIRACLGRHRPALVHSVTLNPAVGQAARDLAIPHVASLYALDEALAPAGPDHTAPRHAAVVHSDSIRYAALWGRVLGTGHACSRALVPEELFALGRRRRWEKDPGGEARPRRIVMTGTLQERKGQWEAIAAVRALRGEGLDCRLEIHGYDHFFPEYLERCRREIAFGGLEEAVRLCGFTADIASVLERADILVCASTFESFPNSLKEAMAAGVLVVSTPVGGIPELVVDGVSGILCRDTSVEALVDGLRRAATLTPKDRARVVEQARRVARSECHPQRTVSDLLGIYLRALEVGAGSEGQLGAREKRTEPDVPPPSERPVQPREAPVSHVPLRRHLRYSVEPGADRWVGLDVFIGTHGTQARGEVHLRVLSPDGRALRQASADLSSARDNEWLTFRYVAIENAGGQQFEIELELVAGAGTRVSLYECNPFEGRLRRLLRRAGIGFRGNVLYHRTWHGA